MQRRVDSSGHGRFVGQSLRSEKLYQFSDNWSGRLDQRRIINLQQLDVGCRRGPLPDLLAMRVHSACKMLWVDLGAFAAQTGNHRLL